VFAAPVPESVSHAKVFKQRFGNSRSPAAGATFEFDGTTLTAKFPKGWTGRYEDFTRSLRTERSVSGDFVLTVVMRTNAPAKPPHVRGGKRCDLGGGLAVWEPNLKKPGEVAVGEDEREKCVTVCRYFKEIGDEEWVRGDHADYPGTVYDRHHHEPGDTSELVHLRITRTGDTLTTAYSPDGEKWTETMSRKVPMADRVSVGVWAFEGTNHGYEVTFEKFAVTPVK